ncbi:MAG: flagellar assembly protein FliW [Deltaproteobacteria bacterium]|nr:flagellar assembly protein FliW [Deltaproteobacteria bacterium]
MNETRKINSRFGEIEYDPAKTILFVEGIVGFENLRHFIVIPNEKEGPLFWIQSVEDPQIAFILTDPSQFFCDYQVAPGKAEKEKLGMGEGDDCFVLSVVTVHRDKSVTLNLAAPVFFAPKANKGLQMILEGTPFQTRTQLPTIAK